MSRGFIQKRGNGYRIAVRTGRNPGTGKYEQIWETVKGTKKDAEKRLSEMLNEIDKGVFTKPGRITLGEFFESWLNDEVRPNESHRTYELYDYMVHRHILPQLGQILLTQLKTQHLQHLYSEKLDHGRVDGKGGLSPRTVQLIHVALHKALEYARSPGINLIPWNVADSSSPRVPRREMNTLTESGLHSFLDSVKDSEYYPLFYTYLHTAMRRSELLAVQWSSVDLLGCLLSVTRSMEYNPKAAPDDRIKFKPPKTPGSRRLIDLTPSNAIILRQHQEAQDRLRLSLGLPTTTDDDLAFSHFDGTPYLPQTISHAWMKAVRKAGFYGVRLHDARHTHASIMLKKGVHPKIVQERLGHASISTTLDTYSHVVPGLQKAAAVKFDEITLPQESTLDKELKQIMK